jgi:DMSO/TMAO reductase YedYZ molybdopterin-dependent catalytic subunit
MKIRKLLTWSTLLLGTILILTACGGVPKVDWTLTVDGAVSTPLELGYGQLVALPQRDLTDILMEKSLGENETGSWSGPELSVILEKAGIGSFSSITATAADGYAIEIPRDELDDAIIALQKDGKWITEAEPDKGPIRLVCPETPANRWVFQVQTLTVNP